MIKYKKAICYSGYRENQSPLKNIFPSFEEVYQDLIILSKHFSYIRMYDISEHPKTVLSIIKKHNIPLKVMLGVEPKGEISNPNCPWGGLHSDDEIEKHKVFNYQQLDSLAALANMYPDIVLALSVGNENTASWHPNKMDPNTLLSHVKYLKEKTSLPITFCEGAFEWRNNCEKLAAVVDFISIHVYPLWQGIPYINSVKHTINEYQLTKEKYFDKQVIFTEFGWTTSASKQMDQSQTTQFYQNEYLTEMDKWSFENEVPMFIFEAFDEPWKGGNDPFEPEKNWGIYEVDRRPKKWASFLK